MFIMTTIFIHFFTMLVARWYLTILKYNLIEILEREQKL